MAASTLPIIRVCAYPTSHSFKAGLSAVQCFPGWLQIVLDQTVIPIPWVASVVPQVRPLFHASCSPCSQLSHSKHVVFNADALASFSTPLSSEVSMCSLLNCAFLLLSGAHATPLSSCPRPRSLVILAHSSFPLTRRPRSLSCPPCSPGSLACNLLPECALP